MSDTTDYDAIRAQIVALCKAKLELGKPEPEKGYTPRHSGAYDGQKVTLRYSTPFTIAGYKGMWTGPVNGTARYRDFSVKAEVSMGGDWYAKPIGNPSPKHGDVLSSLLMDAQAGSETFEEFCSSFGYDSNSRKAEATWRECQSCLGAMRRAFGADLEAATELAYQL